MSIFPTTSMKTKCQFKNDNDDKQNHHHYEQGGDNNSNETHSMLCHPNYNFAERNHIKRDKSLDFNHKCKEEDLKKRRTKSFRPVLQPRPSKNRRFLSPFDSNDDEISKKNNSSPFFDDGININRVESVKGNASDINISSLDDYDSSTISFPIKRKRGSSSLSSSVQEEDEVDTTTTSMSSPSSSSSSSYLNDFAQQDVTQTSWSQLTNNDLLTSPPLSDREVSLITPQFPPNCSHPLCYHHISTTSTLNTTFINTPLPQSCLIPLLLSENNR